MTIERKVIFNCNAKVHPAILAAPAAPMVINQVVTTQSTSTSTQVVMVQWTMFRRLKDSVNKKTNFERSLAPEERGVLIRWWNQNQRLVPKEDSVCAQLTAEVNGCRKVNKISNMQVAGYSSYLCRLGLWAEERRRARILRNIRRGQHTIPPVFTDALLSAIKRNWELVLEDERQRAIAHEQMRQARAQGKHLRMPVTIVGDARAVLTPTLTQVGNVRSGTVGVKSLV